MINLRSFNESAGQLYREVDDEEFESHMDSQQVDTFSKGELQILFDILQGTTRVIEVWLYKVSGPKMSDITHITNPAKVRVLKTYEIDNNIDEIAYKKGHRYKTIVYDLEGRKESIVSYPRTPANKIYIWDEGLSWQIPMEITITKSCDDYFYAYVTTRRVDYYICDGLAGLKSLLVDLFEWRKAD